MQTILPRVMLNNLAIKLNEGEISISKPKHQDWALHVFDTIKSDLVPDYINKMELTSIVTEDLLLQIAKK